jgi:hypothetical protein
MMEILPGRRRRGDSPALWHWDFLFRAAADCGALRLGGRLAIKTLAKGRLLLRFLGGGLPGGAGCF